MHNFKEGDRVRHRFAGTLMMISLIDEEGIDCEWWLPTGELRRAYFEPEVLIAADSDDTEPVRHAPLHPV